MRRLCVARQLKWNESRATISCQPERAIHATRKLSRVAHERAPVTQAVFNEFLLGRPDSAIHHVAWGDTMRPGSSITQRDLRDSLDGRPILNRTIRVGDSAGAVRCVRAETNVAAYVQIWEEGPEFANCEDNGTTRVVGLSTAVVLERAEVGRVRVRQVGGTPFRL